MKIVTLTVNPALDKSTSVDQIIPEKKLRCAVPKIEAGGGGINVSKGLARLGTRSTAVLPVGGNNGKYLQMLIRDEGIQMKCLQIAGETRESFSVSDTSSHLQYRFVLPGTPISEAEATQLLDMVEGLKPDIIVASGSLPMGLRENWYADVAKLAHRLGAKFILDTGGQPLIEATKAGVYLLKPNLNELSALAGVDELELDQVDDAARDLISQGKVEVVVVSLGSKGAVLVTKDRLEHVPVPPMKSKTTVGAGDSMVAGMVWSMNKKASLGEMVRMGVACGSAATLATGTQLFLPEDAWKVMDWIKAYGQKYRFTDF